MNTWRVTLLLLIWRQNASYRQAASCGPSRSPLEFPFVATCCTGEFRPRSRCCCTPTSLCLMSHWKQGSLTNQPSTGVFARSLELHQDGSIVPNSSYELDAFDIQGNYAYVLGDNGNQGSGSSAAQFYVVDITNPASMAVVSTTPITGFINYGQSGIRVQGQYVYLVSSTGTAST